MASDPVAAVVLVNHNGRHHLAGCLEALRPEAGAAGAEVLVFDNASGDGSAEYLRREHPWVRLVRSTRNLGFAAANNVAMRETRGRHLVLLNTDTRVRPGWLAALLDAADSDPQVAAVTSRLVFADRPDLIQNAGLLLLSDGSGADRGAGAAVGAGYDRREEVFGACGAAMLLRREAFEESGGFDDTFFMYYEDMDLSWRLRLLGWRILFEPSAVVEHVHAATSREWSDFFTFHADRNRLFTVLKNGSPELVAGSFSSLLGRAAGNALGSLGGRGERAANRGGRRASVHGRVLASFLAHAPQMLARRRAIRRARRTPDSEIERWMYPRSAWDAR